MPWNYDARLPFLVRVNESQNIYGKQNVLSFFPFMTCFGVFYWDLCISTSYFLIGANFLFLEICTKKHLHSM